MAAPIDSPVFVLAGGQSRRFGSPKGLVQFEGDQLIHRVIEGLKAQTSAPIVINAALDGPYAGLGYDIVPDPMAGHLGPLAGLLAAMTWAGEKGHDQVATAPVDTPFLPSDYLSTLASVGGPAVASSNGRRHPVCGLWPVGLGDRLRAFLERGDRAVWRWCDDCGAKAVEFQSDQNGRDPFFNINTREDLDACLKGART